MMRESLKKQQKLVIELVLEGMTNNQIAQRVGASY